MCNLLTPFSFLKSMSTKQEQSLGRNDGDEQMSFKHLRERERGQHHIHQTMTIENARRGAEPRAHPYSAAAAAASAYCHIFKSLLFAYT